MDSKTLRSMVKPLAAAEHKMIARYTQQWFVYADDATTLLRTYWVSDSKSEPGVVKVHVTRSKDVAQWSAWIDALDLDADITRKDDGRKTIRIRG